MTDDLHIKAELGDIEKKVKYKSYHTRISKEAKKIEISRERNYSRKYTTLGHSKKEIEFMSAILQKALRLQRARNIKTFRNDLLDIYNYSAMLFEEVI